jgi:hypothetical protein
MEKSPSVVGRHLLSMNILKEEIDAYSLLKNDKVLNWVKNLEVHQVGYLLEIQDGLKRSRSIPHPFTHFTLFFRNPKPTVISKNQIPAGDDAALLSGALFYQAFFVWW